jgi:hypothetical protein
MPSNEFRTAKGKEQRGGSKKRKRRTVRERKGNEGKCERAYLEETIPMFRTGPFLFPLALTFGYFSGLRKMDLS